MLNQLCFNIVINKYKYNSTYNWEYLSKNFDTINDDFIAENNLLKLNLHILVLGYLEDRLSCFIKIIEDENENEEE